MDPVTDQERTRIFLPGTAINPVGGGGRPAQVVGGAKRDSYRGNEPSSQTDGAGLRGRRGRRRIVHHHDHLPRDGVGEPPRVRHLQANRVGTYL